MKPSLKVWKDSKDYHDETLACKICQIEFVFTSNDKLFYAQNGYDKPIRCTACRNDAKAGVCYFFQIGKCNRGSKCKYIHPGGGSVEMGGRTRFIGRQETYPYSDKKEVVLDVIQHAIKKEAATDETVEEAEEDSNAKKLKRENETVVYVVIENDAGKQDHSPRFENIPTVVQLLEGLRIKDIATYEVSFGGLLLNNTEKVPTTTSASKRINIKTSKHQLCYLHFVLMGYMVVYDMVFSCN